MKLALALGLWTLAALSPQAHLEVSSDGLETVQVLPQPPRGVGSPDVPYPTTPDWSNDLRIQVGGLQAADLDGDGRDDVVLGCYQSNSFPPYDDWRNFAYFNQGRSLEPSPSWASDDARSTGDLQVALINDDPYPDVIAGNGGGSYDPTVIYFGTPNGPSTSPGWLSNDSAWTSYALPFDFDHDGDVDLFTANQGRSQLDPHRPMYGFLNNGGVLETTPSWQSDETSIQNFLAFGDLDGDGWEDLAVSKWIGFESGIYRNAEGVLATTPVWTTGADGADRGVGWARVDGDSRPELALGTDPTLVYENDNGTLTNPWMATGTFFGHSELRWEDVDLDGDADLAEVHFGNGQVHIYLNRLGVLDTTPAWTYDSAAVGTALAFGDIDHDGAPDLIVGNSGDPSVMVFLNRSRWIFVDGFESGDTTAWTAFP